MYFSSRKKLDNGSKTELLEGASSLCMAYWIIRQKAINVFVPGALSCNDPLRKTLSSPAGWKRHLWRPIASKDLTKLSILPYYNVLGSFVQLVSLDKNHDFCKKGVLKLKLQNQVILTRNVLQKGSDDL